MVDYRDLLKKYMKYLEDHGALGDMFATEDLMVSDPQRHFDREEFKALVSRLSGTMRASCTSFARMLCWNDADPQNVG